jgi:predicted phosphate transport protein (TIGR00153 family)
VPRENIASAISLFLPEIQLMALNTFLKIFLPKDRIFYSLFEDSSERVLLMSKTLKQLVNEVDTAKRKAVMAQIEDLEHLNDEATHKIFTELSRNFITPFDREDIHYLATALDDVADHIYAAAKKIMFYHIHQDDYGLSKFADLIEQSAEQVCLAVKELRNMKNLRQITEAIVKINSIENQADDLFDHNIERLFAEVDDAKEVIKMREIYQVMEDATDKCEDAGNVIESIIIKYA